MYIYDVHTLKSFNVLTIIILIIISFFLKIVALLGKKIKQLKKYIEGILNVISWVWLGDVQSSTNKSVYINSLFYHIIQIIIQNIANLSVLNLCFNFCNKKCTEGVKCFATLFMTHMQARTECHDGIVSTLLIT